MKKPTTSPSLTPSFLSLAKKRSYDVLRKPSVGGLQTSPAVSNTTPISRSEFLINPVLPQAPSVVGKYIVHFKVNFPADTLQESLNNL